MIHYTANIQPLPAHTNWPSLTGRGRALSSPHDAAICSLRVAARLLRGNSLMPDDAPSQEAAAAGRARHSRIEAAAADVKTAAARLL